VEEGFVAWRAVGWEWEVNLRIGFLWRVDGIWDLGRFGLFGEFCMFAFVAGVEIHT
jgi:hypothetical protein